MFIDFLTSTETVPSIIKAVCFFGIIAIISHFKIFTKVFIILIISNLGYLFVRTSLIDVKICSGILIFLLLQSLLKKQYEALFYIIVIPMLFYPIIPDMIPDPADKEIITVRLLLTFFLIMGPMLIYEHMKSREKISNYYKEILESLSPEEQSRLSWMSVHLPEEYEKCMRMKAIEYEQRKKREDC